MKEKTCKSQKSQQINTDIRKHDILIIKWWGRILYGSNRTDYCISHSVILYHSNNNNNFIGKVL